MRIKRFGHASFLVESKGIRIITDPYLPELIGYPPITEEADVVIMSSNTDPAHSNASMIRGNPRIINTLEILNSGIEIKGVRFEAVASMESLIHKESPGRNAMYRFTLEGMAVGHLGDVGNALNDEQLAFFRDMDILFVLTGGPPTIELDDLEKALKIIRPRITIPMHYKTDRSRVKRILPLEAYVSRYPEEMIHYIGSSEIRLTAADIPESHQIYVLEYTAGE